MCKTFEIASCGFALTGLRRFRQRGGLGGYCPLPLPWPFSDMMYLMMGSSARRSSPIIPTSSGSSYCCRFYRPLMSRYLDAMDMIVATSPNYFATSEVLTEYAHKVEVIPIGLDEPSYPAMQEQNRDLAAARQKYGEDFSCSSGCCATTRACTYCWTRSRVRNRTRWSSSAVARWK